MVMIDYLVVAKHLKIWENDYWLAIQQIELLAKQLNIYAAISDGYELLQ